MSLANVNQPNQIYHITAKQSKQASKQSKEVTERVFVLLRHSLSDEPTSELPFPVDYDPPCLANFIVRMRMRRMKMRAQKSALNSLKI